MRKVDPNVVKLVNKWLKWIADEDVIDKKYVYFERIAMVAITEQPNEYLIFIKELKKLEPKLIKEIKKKPLYDLYLNGLQNFLKNT